MAEDEIREAIGRHLASRRADPAFAERLRRRIEQDAPILARLAEGELDDAVRHAHNEEVRNRCARYAAGDLLDDEATLRRFDRVLAGLPWWAWRRRRFYRSGRYRVLADVTGHCPLCGCLHRPSTGCPDDFIPATLLGIMTAEGIERYDGG